MSNDNAPVRELWHIEPPPEELFSSQEKAVAAIHAWTLQHGFNVVRRSADKLNGDPGAVWRRYYECDQAGKPKHTQHLTEEQRQRPMRGSKKHGCPMRLCIRAVDLDDLDGEWIIHHTRNGSVLHSHPPSREPSVHSDHRRRQMSEAVETHAASLQETIAVQSAVGVRTQNIQAAILYSHPDSLLVAKDISNAKEQAKRNVLGSHTPTEALLRELKEDNFFVRHDIVSETNQLCYLFWSHPEMHALYKIHSDVLIVDCTYNTNVHKMPMLNIISVTGLQQVIPIAQCWLPGEAEVDYRWAFTALRQLIEDKGIALPRVVLTDRSLACMNALKRVFPDVPPMLCWWHVKRNIEGKARKVLGQQRVQAPAKGMPDFVDTPETERFLLTFSLAVEAREESDFHNFVLSLRDQSARLARYLDLNWWPYRDRFVACYTNKIRHFNIRSTSAVEGTHSKMKQWIGTSNGDLYSVFRSLKPYWALRAQDIRMEMQRNETITPHLFQGQRYEAVARRITRVALKQTNALWKTANAIVSNEIRRSDCDGVYRTVNGMPCVHELVAIIDSQGERMLRPEDYDKHWWIRHGQQSVPPRVLAPAAVRHGHKKKQKRNDHRAGRGKNTTAREPTLSERLDRNNPATPPTAHLQDDTCLHDEDMVFFCDEMPPRRWGFAG